MRILYVYNENARSRNVQSGRPYSIYRTFQRRGHEVIDLFPLRRMVDFRYVYDKFKAWLTGRTYGGERHIFYLYAMKQTIEEAVIRSDPDLIFSPSSIPLSLVSTGRCRIFTADATFHDLASTYPRFSKISKQYSQEAHFQEWIAMRTADFYVYPSEWAASSARDIYGANKSKMHVIPFGANIEMPPSSEYISECLNKKTLDKLMFVFVGVDWERKGGDEAYRLVAMLNDNGIAAHLHVIGVKMPNTRIATFHGFLDKGNAEQNSRFTKIMEASHFFILPTSAEAYGISFCEALCYGLPCIAYRVGGVCDIIVEDHNGFFLTERGCTQFLPKIKYIIENWEAYLNLCRNARRDYETKFTWDAFVTGIEQLVAVSPS